MNAYIIRYRTSDYDDDYLIERPSLWRLLLWLVTHAHQCRAIHILRFVKWGSKWRITVRCVSTIMYSGAVLVATCLTITKNASLNL